MSNDFLGVKMETSKIRYYLAPEEARLLLSKEATNYQSIKHSNRHDQAGFLKLRNEKLSTQL